MPGTVPVVFNYQTTDPVTNTLTGTLNTPASIPAGESQTFVGGLLPSAPVAGVPIPIQFRCESGESADSIEDVNTFLLTATREPAPDIVAVAATFVATANIGVSATVEVSVDSGRAHLPLHFSICRAEPLSLCSPVAPPPLTTRLGAGETATFAVRAVRDGLSDIALDPAITRAFVRFRSGGPVVGMTSVAVTTH